MDAAARGPSVAAGRHRQGVSVGPGRLIPGLVEVAAGDGRDQVRPAIETGDNPRLHTGRPRRGARPADRPPVRQRRRHCTSTPRGSWSRAARHSAPAPSRRSADPASRLPRRRSRARSETVSRARAAGGARTGCRSRWRRRSGQGRREWSASRAAITPSGTSSHRLCW